MKAVQMRPFEASDWLGAMVTCPHCTQILKVINADGPHLGRDPSEGNRLDRFWILTLADGATARMWEDRKGVVTNRVTS